jgi:hypothetical protein
LGLLILPLHTLHDCLLPEVLNPLALGASISCGRTCPLTVLARHLLLRAIDIRVERTVNPATTNTGH